MRLALCSPWAEVGKIAAEVDVYFHTDCCSGGRERFQSTFNKNRLRPARDLRPQVFTGPQGVGALYARKGTQLEAMLYGGSHERSRRRGYGKTSPGIVGLGKAAELAIAGFGCGEDKKIAALRDELERELLQDGSRQLEREDAPRVPNTTNICFEGHRRRGAGHRARLERNWRWSTGAACSSGSD